ncbi:hypothetical protein J6590_062913 [Homalodisca vitripennis]|nr:hypothetical protein J6590_062913 [Homalodisca vitripennis]
MAGLQPRESCRNSFQSLGILTAVSLYILETVDFALKSPLPRNRNFHNYNTRHNSNFNLPIHRTSIFSKKPSYAGAKLYNMLPQSIKEGTPSTLKKRLRQWLADIPLYSMEEFIARVRPDVSSAT